MSVEMLLIRMWLSFICCVKVCLRQSRIKDAKRIMRSSYSVASSNCLHLPQNTFEGVLNNETEPPAKRIQCLQLENRGNACPDNEFQGPTRKTLSIIHWAFMSCLDRGIVHRTAVSRLQRLCRSKRMLIAPPPNYECHELSAGTME
jgi:hypothetical protein